MRSIAEVFMREVRAGLIYGGMVFAAGFLFGVLRELVLAPRWGNPAARLIELPFMVTIAWLLAGGVMRRFGRAGAVQALAVGGIAFAVLQSAEVVLASGLAPGGASGYCADILTPVGALAFVAQSLLIVFPWLASRSDADEHP